MVEELLIIFNGNLPNIITLKNDLISLGFEEKTILIYQNSDALKEKPKLHLPPYIIFNYISDDQELNLIRQKELAEKFPGTPIVSLSTNETEEHALTMLEHGAVDCLNLDEYRFILLKKVLLKIKILKEKAQRVNTENAELLKLFLQNPKPLFLIDLNTGKFLNTNQAAQEKYGYSKKEFEDLNVRDIYPQEEIGKLNVCLEKLQDLTEHYTHKGVWKHITKTGKKIVTEVISYRTKYLEKDVLLVLALDITEKYKADKEKEENQKYLDAIFRNTQDAILLADDNGKYINVNDAACKLTQYSKSELLDLHIFDIIIASDGPDRVNNLWYSFKKNTRQSGTIPLKRKNGEIVFTSYKAVANILPGIHLSVLTDVTKSLIEQRYKELLTNIYESILLEHDFTTKLHNILRCICKYLQWDYAEFWVYSDLYDSFFRSAYYCNPGEDSLKNLADQSQTIDIKAEEQSMISLSISKKHAIWIKDLKRSEKFNRKSLLPDSKKFTGLSIPLGQKFLSGTLGVLNMIKASDVDTEPKKDKHLISILENISEVLSSEIERLWFQDDISRVYSNSTNFYGILSSDSTILEMNPAFLKMVKYSMRELLGQKLLSYIHPGDNDRIKEAFLACQKEFKEKKVEFRILTNGKHLKWLNGVLIPDHLSKRIFISGTDITEAKFARNKLELSEKHFKALVQDGSDTIAVLNEKGIYTYLSPNTYKNLYHIPEELIGKSAFKLIHKQDFDYAQQLLKSLENKKSVTTRPLQVKNGLGEWRWIESVLTNMLEDPAVRGIVVNSRDVTDRILSQQEKEKLYRDLKNYNEELLQFSYITSHNLRAPISNLIAISKLIDTSDIQNPQTARLIEGFKKSAQKLDETVNDLVSALVAREEKNIKQEICALSAILENSFQSLHDQIEKVQPMIRINFAEAPKAFFNIQYLESAFLNLLSNAIKYRHPERKLEITINSFTENDKVVIEFSDNGLGIDLKRHKNKIFGFHQRFHDNIEGKGLGLYLIKTQINSLGGSIDIASKVNKGTIFTIKLTKQK